MGERAAGRPRSRTAVWRGIRRPSARRLSLMAAGLLVAVVAAVAVVVLGRPGSEPRAALAAPPRQSGAIPCRQDVMAHVHDPTRLVVVARCSTVSGTVKHVHYEERYGGQRLLVAVDPSYQRFLLPENKGVLTAEVIPTDETTVRIPKAGQHATFSGAFVFDRNERSVELHPVWRIDVSGGLGSGPRTSKASPGERFSVTVHAPPAVPSGGQVAVSVHAELIGRSIRHPSSQVHLFLEVISPKGKSVQWVAASTNALGDATIHLVALQAPGRSTLMLYANNLKLGQQVIVKLPLKVRRQ